MSNSKNYSDLFSNINSRLQHISNVMLLNASFIDDPGLLNGKKSIATFFNHYSRYICEKFPDNGDFLDQTATSGLNTPFTIRYFLSDVSNARLFPKWLNMPNKKNLELIGFAGLAPGLLSERMKD